MRTESIVISIKPEGKPDATVGERKSLDHPTNEPSTKLKPIEFTFYKVYVFKKITRISKNAPFREFHERKRFDINIDVKNTTF